VLKDVLQYENIKSKILRKEFEVGDDVLIIDPLCWIDSVGSNSKRSKAPQQLASAGPDFQVGL
jgi:hypothetical protein